MSAFKSLSSSIQNLIAIDQSMVVSVTILPGQGLRNVNDVYVEEHWREC